MKKPIFIVLALMLLGSLLTYVLIPTLIVVKKSIVVENNPKGLGRCLSDSSKWITWWPAKLNGNKKILNEKEYRLADKTFNSILIDVTKSNTTLKTSLNIIPLTTASVKLQWVAELKASYNPYQRLRTYLYAREIRDDFTTIFDAIKTYYSNSISVYGLDIKREIVQNSSLIYTTDSAKGYPSTEKIYSMLDQLRSYIQLHSAQATDSPMLNINTSDSITYFTRVAIPTNKKLESQGKIQYRMMLGGGNILCAQIKGGNEKVDSAFKIVQQYLQDYGLVAPAIPFYSLVSNRMAERDNNQWVTKIFYPVMYYN